MEKIAPRSAGANPNGNDCLLSYTNTRAFGYRARIFLNPARAISATSGEYREIALIKYASPSSTCNFFFGAIALFYCQPTAANDGTTATARCPILQNRNPAQDDVRKRRPPCLKAAFSNRV